MPDPNFFVRMRDLLQENLLYLLLYEITKHNHYYCLKDMIIVSTIMLKLVINIIASGVGLVKKYGLINFFLRLE